VERVFVQVMTRPGAWTDQALCAETDPEAWYPPDGGNGNDAKAICARCDVKNECLDWALRNGEREGIWGGLSPNQRTKLAKLRRKGAA
jgi:WhiB family redox-sensing transcriptional regulator